MKRTAILMSVLAGIILFSGTVFAAVDTARVISFEGDVQVFPQAAARPVSLEREMLLAEGTRVVTGGASFLELALNSDASNRVRIDGNTECVIKIDSMTGIELIDGKIFTFLKDMDRQDTFIVRTPSAVCGARGTGWVTEHGDDTTIALVFDDRIFTQGINPDGSVMERRFWTEQGFARKIRKHSQPGRPQRVRRDRVNQLRGIMGVPRGVTGDREKRSDKQTQNRERRIDRTEGRRDRRRIDKLIEEKSKKTESCGPSGNGYSIDE